jgi:hypothetical protein
MAYTNIDDPSAYFQALAYTASTATPSQTFTNDGNSDLKPDLLWVKNRSGWGSRNHVLWDSSRGTNANLTPNETTAEQTTSYQTFNTNGFTVPEGFATAYSAPYVAWQFKANGGTTASNTDGNTTTTVQANQDAGFSIVTYTGTGSGSQTMGHGLGVTPNIVLTKARSGTSNWSFNGNFGGMTYGTNRLLLNTTAALTADTNEVTAASSTTFTGGGSSGVNSNGSTFVAYCFAEKQGYSKFGKYVGNGSANGAFVYTGFKPAFFLLKKTSAADGWRLFDNKRAGYNDDNYRLAPDATDAEDTATTYLDILSNGVKIRGTAGSFNQSGGTFIYMAFAEHPFVNSKGVPTTAR